MEIDVEAIQLLADAIRSVGTKIAIAIVLHAIVG